MSLNVSLGISTWLWTSPFSTETTVLFPKIKNTGYDAVEIPVEEPSLIDAEKVKEALAQNGLKPIMGRKLKYSTVHLLWQVNRVTNDHFY
ncbi:MAG: hypothetical protein WD426_04240 [Anditalea sp.]